MPAEPMSEREMLLAFAYANFPPHDKHELSALRYEALCYMETNKLLDEAADALYKWRASREARDGK